MFYARLVTVSLELVDLHKRYGNVAALDGLTMSVAAGRRIPVVPVVAFLGSGEVVYYGQPPDGCVMTTYRDLGRALNAHGSRVTETTIRKLLIVAAYVDSDTIGQYLDIRG